jgi:hypothetical protein
MSRSQPIVITSCPSVGCVIPYGSTREIFKDSVSAVMAANIVWGAKGRHIERSGHDMQPVDDDLRNLLMTTGNLLTTTRHLLRVDGSAHMPVTMTHAHENFSMSLDIDLSQCAQLWRSPNS